jgi:hypothetical protein
LLHRPAQVERPGPDGRGEWLILIGAGLKGVGGTALVYRSARLREGGLLTLLLRCC